MASSLHTDNAPAAAARSLTPWIVAAVAVVAVATAGVAVAVTRTSRTSRSAPHPAASAPAGHNRTTAGHGPRTKPRPVRPFVALAVRSVSPSSAAADVATDALVSITFSVPPSADSPDPSITPAIPGHWTRIGRSLVFHPSAGFIPSTKVTVDVPATVAAVEGSKRTTLGSAYETSFAVGSGSVLRLQQLLAELRYLPLNFDRTTTVTVPATPPATAAPTTAAPTTTAPTTAAPTTAAPGPLTTVPHAASATTAATAATSDSTSTSTTTVAAAPTVRTVEVSQLASEPTDPSLVRTTPRAGRFVWASPNVPPTLAAAWSVGTSNLATRGAVMAFEGDHGLAVDGVAGPEVWTALLKAVAARQVDPRPYSYIMVTKVSPETLSVWQGGRIVYTTLANTGVPGADTTDGTYPVNSHLLTTTMKGTDVDGTKYVDPGIPYVAYFNGGDAIHGYPRYSYGYPQSNGCVELPIANAGYLFTTGDDWYGTLVTVSGPVV